MSSTNIPPKSDRFTISQSDTDEFEVPVDVGQMILGLLSLNVEHVHGHHFEFDQHCGERQYRVVEKLLLRRIPE